MGGRVFVLAARQQLAVDWCRANGVPPWSRSTVLISRAERTHGFELHPDDRVVRVEPPGHPIPDSVLQAWDFIEWCYERFYSGPLVKSGI